MKNSFSSIFRGAVLTVAVISVLAATAACTKLPEGYGVTTTGETQDEVPATAEALTTAQAEPGESATGETGPADETVIIYYSVPITGGEQGQTQYYTASEQVRLLAGKHYYLDMVLTGKDGDVNAMKIALDGDNLYMTTNISGIDMGLLIKGNKRYILFQQKNSYCELSATLMKMIGLSEDDLNLELGVDDQALAAPTVRQEVVNGETVMVESYVNPATGSVSDFYIRNGSLYRAITTTTDGTKQVMDINTITSDIPGGIFDIPSSYEQISVLELIKAMAS